MWYHYPATGMKREKFVFIQYDRETCTPEENEKIHPRLFRHKSGTNWVILHKYDQDNNIPYAEEIMFLKRAGKDYWISRNGMYKVKWHDKLYCEE
jgi:hypothetical protein